MSLYIGTQRSFNPGGSKITFVSDYEEEAWKWLREDKNNDEGREIHKLQTREYALFRNAIEELK